MFYKYQVNNTFEFYKSVVISKKNMKKILIIVLFFFVFCLQTQSQQYKYISGIVKDKNSGEVLPNAGVFHVYAHKSTTTNNFGYFCIYVNSDTCTIDISYTGYERSRIFINSNRDTLLIIQLVQNNQLQEVSIYSQADNSPRRNNLGAYLVNIEDIKKQPILLGERDVLKTLQTLPGVQAGKEGTTGLNVRGGTPDQNLILLDGVPVYNVNHLFGFLSLFSPDALKSVSFYKNGIPARYGGRLSSVIDIQLKDGNNQKLAGSGNIGLLSSSFTLEMPIVKNKSSFMFSGRRTYIDLLFKPFDTNVNGTNLGGYYFYDFCAKLNYSVNYKNKIFVSTYMGDDFYTEKKNQKHEFGKNYSSYNTNNKLTWGNKTMALRWNYLFNNRLFVNSTLSYTQYRYFYRQSHGLNSYVDSTNTSSFANTLGQIGSGIENFSLKQELSYYLNKHDIKIGYNFTLFEFKPGSMHKQTKSNFANFTVDEDTTFHYTNIKAKDLTFYIEDTYKISDIFEINYGLNNSNFIVDNKIFRTLQPRFLFNIYLPNILFTGSYTRTSQPIHLVSNSASGLPSDLWLPATKKIVPENGNMYNLGYSATHFKIHYGVDFYYKKMFNVLEFREGAFSNITDIDWQTLVVQGNGESFGSEFFTNFTIKKFDFNISYSLSKSMRKFNDLNFGKEFPYRYDRRNNLSITAKYSIKSNIHLSFAFYFFTGEAVTFATQRSITAFQTTSEYYHNNLNGTIVIPTQYDIDTTGYFSFNRSSRIQFQNVKGKNNFRMPNYHRLDVAINFEKQKKHFKRIIALGVYNVYNKLNPFYYYYEYDFNSIFSHYGNSLQRTNVKQMTLFPFLPYVSYYFNF